MAKDTAVFGIQIAKFEQNLGFMYPSGSDAVFPYLTVNMDFLGFIASVGKSWFLVRKFLC